MTMRLIDYVLLYGALLVFAGTMLMLFFTAKDLLSASAEILREIRQRRDALDESTPRQNDRFDHHESGTDRSTS